MRRFGLIGKTLKHSFSQKYFQQFFTEQGLSDHEYDLFELDAIDELQSVLAIQGLVGLNVTIPYKEQVMHYCTKLDNSASKVGAVNVLKIWENQVVGYNSDYYGFKTSLENWYQKKPEQALVLGTGGAAKAVMAVLDNLDINYQRVSRIPGEGILTYNDLNSNTDLITSHQLIVNTTPLGMSPNTEGLPDLPYSKLNEEHLLYDLVYNPEQTQFMIIGKKFGARVKNGLEMLYLQAQKSWDIWNQ